MLFLADGVGALLSAFLLGIVLAEYHSLIGMPPSSLYFLAVFPCLFFLYDGYCLIQKPFRLGPYLKGIAWLNVLYMLISVGFAIWHASTITLLGWCYIGTELLIIAGLAKLEFDVGQSLSS